MGSVEIVDLSSDDESEKAVPVAVKLEPGYVTRAEKERVIGDRRLVKCEKSQTQVTRQDADENISCSAPSTGHSNSSVLEQGPSPIDDTGISYASSICAAPLSRQFWKAGSYDDGHGSQTSVKGIYMYILITFICVCELEIDKFTIWFHGSVTSQHNLLPTMFVLGSVDRFFFPFDFGGLSFSDITS